MEQAIIAIHKQWRLILIIVTLLSACLFMCIFISRKNHTKRRDFTIYAIGLCVGLIMYSIVVIIPFAHDCFSNTIIVEQGVYHNILGDRKRSFSAKSGVYSVTLETDDGKLNLSTAPWCEDYFPTGEYNVTAYYLPVSKTLLYIEILPE